MAPRRTTEVLASGRNIRWAVLWVVPDDEEDYRIVRKEFEGDLDGAIDLFNKAKAKGRRMVTLMSPNTAFPPPVKWRPSTKRRVVVKEVRVLRKGRYVKKRKKVLETYYDIPMERLNRKGIFWCPYCRQMRKFQRQTGMTSTEGNWMEAPGMYCPMCGVSHRLKPVRDWNPHAARLYVTQTRSRQSTTSGSTKRSTTRRRRTRS
jgi:hypothetical protein